MPVATTLNTTLVIPPPIPSQPAAAATQASTQPRTVSGTALPQRPASLAAPIPQQKGKLQNHWSFYVLVTGVALGITGLVLAILLKLGPILITAFCVITVTNLIGAIVIRKFSMLEGLDEQVKKLTQNLQVQKQYILDLEKVQQEQSQLNNQLAGQVEERRKMYADENQKMEDQLGQINTYISDLNLSKDQFDKLTQFYTSLFKTVKLESDNFIQAEAGYKDSIQKLTAQLAQEQGDKQTLSGIVDTLTKKSDEYKTTVDRQTTEIESLKTALSDFQLGVQGEMTQIETAKAKEKENLEAGTKLIDQQSDLMAKSIEVMTDMNQHLDDATTLSKSQLDFLALLKQKTGSKFDEFVKKAQSPQAPSRG